MSKRLNLINNILSLLITVGLVFLVVFISNERFTDGAFYVVLSLVLSAIISGFIITFLHELGHLVFGKANGFKLISFTVWFLRWSRKKGKTVFDFTWFGEEAGYTEMVASSPSFVDKGFKRMTFGGLLFTLIPMLLGIVPFFLPNLPIYLFVFWSMFLPIGAYVFFGNALPMEDYGVANDGEVLRSLRKNTDTSKVTLSLLKIQSELYNGKTPSEISDSYYFDVPQLREDDLNFVLLLNARYYYYLDCGDYEDAKKVSDRAITLLEYLPKSIIYAVKADALFNACTFDFNETVADDLTYELEKYLNSVNSATNLRIKLAYLKNVKKEQEIVEIFYKKAIKEAKKIPVEGLKKLEIKLIENLVKN